MAGISGTGSSLHSFHQGRGGGATGGLKCQHTNVAQVANTLTPATNAAENTRRQGLLILTKRHGKDAAPNPHRPAIRGTNSSSKASLLRSAYDSAHSTQNRIRGEI